MKNNKLVFLKSLLKELTTPAYGCTEIGIVAYACAAAAKNLKSAITKADIYVSPFIYRNDANVGVPHMGKIGIEAIAAAGFVVKNPRNKLSVLSKISKTQCEQAKAMGNKKIIKVHVELHCDPVFVKVIAVDKNNNTCEVLIEGQHDVIRRIKFNNTILEQNQSMGKQQAGKYKFNVNEISLADIYHCVHTIKLNELKFLEKGVEMNHKVKQHGMDNKDHFTEATHKTVSTT
jgi:L-cysteine desulfidase